jgi:hypothetical protein
MLKAALLLGLALLAGPGRAEPAKAWPTVEVFMPAVCLACIDWAEHLRQNGLTVKVTQVPEKDMEAVKRRLKVPKDLEAVPSATVAGYFIEGHVHADQIKELLTEKPKALGLAVPGLPLGAPGREFSSPTCETACTMLDKDSTGTPRVRREFYETLLVKKDGKTSIYARH